MDSGQESPVLSINHNYQKEYEDVYETESISPRVPIILDLTHNPTKLVKRVDEAENCQISFEQALILKDGLILIDQNELLLQEDFLQENGKPAMDGPHNF